jgi:hypothetical protein
MSPGYRRSSSQSKRGSADGSSILEAIVELSRMMLRLGLTPTDARHSRRLRTKHLVELFLGVAHALRLGSVDSRLRTVHFVKIFLGEAVA